MSNAIDYERLRLFAIAVLGLVGVVLVVSRILDVSIVHLGPLYMFTPMLAGLVVCHRHDVSLGEVGLRRGCPRWLVVAAVVSLPLVGVMLLLSLAIPTVVFSPETAPLGDIPVPDGVLGLLITLGAVLLMGSTINAVFAFGEEFGWRGYLLWELAPMGFWHASVVIGIVWGLWHAPLILAGYNYASFPIVGILAMVAACVAFSPLYTYLVLKARSVIAAALLHGVFNASAGLVFVYASVESPVIRELLASPVGLVGIVSFGTIALLVYWVDTPRLRRPLHASTEPT